MINFGLSFTSAEFKFTQLDRECPKLSRSHHECVPSSISQIFKSRVFLAFDNFKLELITTPIRANFVKNRRFWFKTEVKHNQADSRESNFKRLE